MEGSEEKIVQLRKGIKEFDEALKASEDPSATSWDLIVSNNNKFDDDALKYTANTLLKFKNLRSLNLHFDKTGITDEGVSYLSNVISGLKDLTSLGVLLRPEDLPEGSTNQPNITDKGAQAISAALGNLSNLKVLAIIFSWTTISDKTLEIISQSLSKISSLGNLVLELFGCGQITDSGFNLISYSLSKMQVLKTLRYGFNYTKVSDKSLEELANGLVLIPAMKSEFSNDPQALDSNISPKLLGLTKQSFRISLWCSCSAEAKKHASDTLKQVKGRVYIEE